ncbi:hypothetical protein PV08_03017 [Exophiala spinifera]|uniref:Uncharacterized protein n=1 Tax=Exophiala spinifera TaxID=91928 RepID=A0A0D2BIE5_9EURO|nr:uncharacterized protein PV08_03017 [Exophiala spinifera]KIW18728.1 hypothetical protein PV08_03017 [Exophiala spinifera]
MIPSRLLAVFALAGVSVTAGPGRPELKHVGTRARGEEFFQLDNITYLTDTLYPAYTEALAGVHDLSEDHDVFPLTHIIAEAPVVTGKFLGRILERYEQEDDVFNHAFLHAVLISSSSHSAELDESAVTFLESLNLTHVFLDAKFSGCLSQVRTSASFPLSVLRSDREGRPPPGPYYAIVRRGTLSLSSVFRLYTDHYRAFVDGVYSVNDGTGRFRSLGFFSPEWPVPSIPVPSRIYSWTDDRPLAGQRFGVKDIFDVKGLVTTSGSIAWAMVTDAANATAPAIQRILDLGGVIVGKPKTSQFASAGEPWVWDDAFPPFNPRGDGWLSCSASSAGSACAVAAYPWLDFAIGSDTGTSMRRPAAVAGVYGQRPSVGRMTLEGVTPISYSTDTAGVFCRDPHKWINFSRQWYTPGLYQDPAITGLPAYDKSALLKGMPKKILYPIDYLPLKNPAAELALQSFLAKVTSKFDIPVELFNWTERIESLPLPLPLPGSPQSDTASSSSSALSLSRLLSHLLTLWIDEQHHLVGTVLVSKFASRFSGLYPPLEPPMRTSFASTPYTPAMHESARAARRLAVAANEAHIQRGSDTACSESLILSDIGTGGYPAYREEALNHGANASFLAPPGTGGTPGDFCPFFGCVDATLPIGQVAYWSKKTHREEMMPVTIGLVAKRGCDDMLYDFVEKLTDAGILEPVRTGTRVFG